MRLIVLAVMMVTLGLTGCTTLTGGGCGHQKYVKCVRCRAEDEAKEQAKEQAKKAVKCAKCGMLKNACKCEAAKCEKCGDSPCVCKK